MRALAVAALLLVPTSLAGCGGYNKSSAPSTSTGRARVMTTSGATPALQAEAASAATGDIPDNQAFLTFHDGAVGYSMRYPEGWAQRGSGSTVTFRDKNNIVRVVVRRGTASDPTSIRRELAAIKGVAVKSGPQQLTMSGAPVVKVVYTTQSSPNPVTGKRVTLLVDRYYLGHGGKRAVIDLGTPEGVDNVDAYRLMIQSFRWR